MITIANQPTRQASMLTHGQCLANRCPAGTGLRCAPWVNFHEHAPSTLSLVREIKEKVGPAYVVDGLREHPASKPFDIQIFDRDQPALIDDVPTCFVVKIPPLIANVIMEPLQKDHGFASATRSSLATRHASLQTPEFCPCVSEPARVSDLFAVAESGKRCQPDIDADHVRTKGQRLSVNLDGEQSKPTTRFAFHGEGFDIASERTVQFDAHLTDLRQIQTLSLKCVPDLAKGHTVIATRGTESRVASSFLCIFGAAKERLKRQMDTMQSVLKNVRVHGGNVCASSSNILQLKVLIEPRDRFTFALPSVASFLKRGIVQFATYGKLIVKNLFLALCRVNPIAAGANHPNILTGRFSLEN